MRITKLLQVVAGAAALAFVASGCAAAETDNAAEAETTVETSTEETTNSDALTIGLIMLQGDTYFQGIQAGLEEAVAADGGTIIPGISNGDPAEEFNLAQSMIQADVDAVLMQPAADEASVPAMQAIREAGITLICYGNCLGVTADPENVDGSIMSDNTALGTGTGIAAVAWVQENLADAESIDLAILNCDIASACKLRKAGFLAELENAGYTVNIVTDQEGYLIDVATPVAQNILAANPDIDMVWASNEGGTAGAVIGTEGSGKAVFGTDISTQIAEFILDPTGGLQATTGQDPVSTSQGAYEMAKVVLSGGTLDVFNVEIPGIVYDRANSATAEEFLAANQ